MHDGECATTTVDQRLSYCIGPTYMWNKRPGPTTIGYEVLHRFPNGRKSSSTDARRGQAPARYPGIGTRAAFPNGLAAIGTYVTAGAADKVIALLAPDALDHPAIILEPVCPNLVSPAIVEGVDLLVRDHLSAVEHALTYVALTAVEYEEPSLDPLELLRPLDDLLGPACQRQLRALHPPTPDEPCGKRIERTSVHHTLTGYAQKYTGAWNGASLPRSLIVGGRTVGTDTGTSY